MATLAVSIFMSTVLKSTKNLHVTFLTLLLLVNSTAVVHAQFTYETNDGSITITGYTGPPWVVTIPTNINGLTVTTIGASAFLHSTSLTSVTIPGSVTAIGQDAFVECSGLISVTFGNGVTNFGDSIFGGCSSLTNVTISNGLVSIGSSMFAGCSSLTSVTIPSSATNIGESAFSDCNSLITVTISNGVTSIGEFAFEYDPIPSIMIPESVTNIGYATFLYCNDMTNVTIPGSVTSIGDFAFYGCSSLINATVANGVPSVAYGLFDFCTNLAGVFFQGDSPTVVGDSEDGPVFYDDNNVTVYYLPGNIGWSNTYQGVPAVLWNPQVQAGGANFGVKNGQFGFNVTGTANIPIVVQACTNLANPAWTSLTNVTLTNSPFFFSEPFQANTPARYYRISSP